MAFFNQFKNAVQTGLAEAQRGTQQIGVGVDTFMVQREIDNLKSAWGKECFDAFQAGDLKTCSEKAEATKAKIQLLERRLQGNENRSSQVNAAADAALPIHEQPLNVQVVVPDGAVPGSTFEATMPNQRRVTITVPPGAVPGQTIAVNVSGTKAVAMQPAAAVPTRC